MIMMGNWMYMPKGESLKEEVLKKHMSLDLPYIVIYLGSPKIYQDLKEIY